MNTAFERIRDQQKEIRDRFSPGWRKWDEFLMTYLAERTAGYESAAIPISGVHQCSSQEIAVPLRRVGT